MRLLAGNLLADPEACRPASTPTLGSSARSFILSRHRTSLKSASTSYIATASAIGDPFEQAFFVMVQLPYLQPFDDVNKRVELIKMCRGTSMPRLCLAYMS